MKLTPFEKFNLFIITHIFSAFVLVPVAILKIFTILLNFVHNAVSSPYTQEKHAEKVKYVQKQILDWIATGRKTKMCTGRKAWANLSVRKAMYKDWMTGINVDMGDIVKIDTFKKTVTLEPLMTMEQLTATLIPLGWTIPVVPELNDLTIGGLIAGAGVETSSHKYGLIHNICVSYEIVLSDGQVVTCTKDDRSDLFHAISGSCGTLGFITAVEVKIIPAKKYVKLEYMPVKSLDEIVSTFEKETFRESGNEFVEGIMYSLNSGIIMTGDMTDEAEPGKVNSVCRWYKPWFYKHAEQFLKTNPSENVVEYIPLRDYYHRHSQALFWELEYMIPYTSNIVFRYLFGWILPLRVWMLKLFTPHFIRKVVDKNHVTQDFLVPIEKLKESLILTHEEMEVYPIWLCPAKLMNTPGGPRFLTDADEMYVDFGVYGMTQRDDYELVKSARKLELFCIKNRGYQALYSDICLTKEEFGEMYDLTLYNRVREQLKCEDAFPDVYDKVRREVRK